MNRASRPHDEAVVELLRNDPEFTAAYLSAAFGEAGARGGREAMIAALRQVAEARGMARIAERSRMPRESLYRVLSPRGNPRLETLLSVVAALDLQLDVRSAETIGSAVTGPTP